MFQPRLAWVSWLGLAGLHSTEIDRLLLNPQCINLYTEIWASYNFISIYPLYVYMVTDPSDCKDCLPYEAPHQPVADLTKLPTWFPFCTSTFFKTTHSVLLLHGQKGPKTNLRDLTHLSTIPSYLVYWKLLQSIANILRCPVYISCKSN